MVTRPWVPNAVVCRYPLPGNLKSLLFSKNLLVIPEHVHPCLARVVIHGITFIALWTETHPGHRWVALDQLALELITLEYTRMNHSCLHPQTNGPLTQITSCYMDLSSQASASTAFAMLLVALRAGHNACQTHLWCSSLVISTAHTLQLLRSPGPNTSKGSDGVS